MYLSCFEIEIALVNDICLPTAKIAHVLELTVADGKDLPNTLYLLLVAL